MPACRVSRASRLAAPRNTTKAISTTSKISCAVMRHGQDVHVVHLTPPPAICEGESKKDRKPYAPGCALPLGIIAAHASWSHMFSESCFTVSDPGHATILSFGFLCCQFKRVQPAIACAMTRISKNFAITLSVSLKRAIVVASHLIVR